ncbi:hypothetical protein O9993_10150 [Vibrio lentus]|nr:hypothetical protein [Vibrio lentus]
MVAVCVRIPNARYKRLCSEFVQDMMNTAINLTAGTAMHRLIFIMVAYLYSLEA